jgi:hypothetical protein
MRKMCGSVVIEWWGIYEKDVWQCSEREVWNIMRKTYSMTVL